MELAEEAEDGLPLTVDMQDKHEAQPEDDEEVPDKEIRNTLDEDAEEEKSVPAAGKGDDVVGSGSFGPVSDPFDDTVITAVADAVVETQTDPTTDAVEESKADPATDPVTELEADPTSDAVEESKADPATDPVNESEADPTTEAVVDPDKDLVADSVDQSPEKE